MCMKCLYSKDASIALLHLTQIYLYYKTQPKIPDLSSGAFFMLPFVFLSIFLKSQFKLFKLLNNELSSFLFNQTSEKEIWN